VNGTYFKIMKHLLLTTIAVVVLVGCGEGSRHLNLYEAAESGDIEAVKQHLADGTDIELKCTGCGSTALGHAAKNGHKEIAEILIAEGADVSAKTDDGGTPLHLAALNGHKEIVELIIAKGADVNAKIEKTGDEVGLTSTEIFLVLTPLDWAIEDNHTEIADLLRKHGGKTGTELKAEGK